MVGTGYVGLVSGACFSEFGIDVICVDNVKEKIDMLNNGIMPIYEPGLDVLIQKNVKEDRLSFTTDLKDAIEKCLVVFISVGTPPNPDGSPNLRYVWEVAEEVAGAMNGYKVIVNKSTVPVGTGEKMKSFIQEKLQARCNFSVVSNPEFLREGSAIDDFMRPDRVVIGVDDSEAAAIMKDLYSPLYLIEKPVIITSVKSAELIKYAANSYLAMRVSYINEISNICEKVGADVHQVALGMGLDNRIGKKFLHPGPGYGGSCFPKDTRAFLQLATEHDYDFKIMRAVIEVNERQKSNAIDKIVSKTGEVSGKTIGILGLSFKPNTDDMRDSPSVPIITHLLKEGATVKVYDPVAMEESKKHLNGETVQYCESVYEVAEGCDALVFLTEWNQFRKIDLEKIKKLLGKPVVIDLRNIYEPEAMRQMGFDYTGMGR
jgi:UDPglucose 6-dehydrogenase